VMLATARSSTSRAVDGRDGPHAPRAQVHHDVAGKHRGNRALRDQPALMRSSPTGSCSRTSRLPFASGTSWTLGRATRQCRHGRVTAERRLLRKRRHKITGPVIDQAEIVPDFRDPEIQDHAYEAIQRFVPSLVAA